MLIPRMVLWLSASVFALFGCLFTARPQAMARVVEIELPTATAMVDFAATYGGFELGFAVFLAICTREDEWVRPGLLASACALGGFAVVRAAGILAPGGAVNALMYPVLALEIGGAALSVWAFRRARH